MRKKKFRTDETDKRILPRTLARTLARTPENGRAAFSRARPDSIINNVPGPN